MKKILFLGGGTGGHILPLLPLARAFEKKGILTEFVFADTDLDRRIASENFSGFSVSFFKTGKLRRYFSFKNFLDFFLLFRSFFLARSFLKKSNPDALFFKGGFVGFPFLVAAILFRFKGKIYCHESDISPGILTRLVSRFSDYSFKSFGDPSYPLFFVPEKNLPRIHFESKTVLFLGGSQGALFINKLLEKNFDDIVSLFRVILISGPGKKILKEHPFLEQYETLPAEKLSQILSSVDFVVSRGGANSLFEIIYAQKPSIIIPLPSSARNHQFLNAHFFEKKGLCRVLEEKEADRFFSVFSSLTKDPLILKKLAEYPFLNSAEKIVEIVLQKNKFE